jgi:hypothetical protein
MELTYVKSAVKIRGNVMVMVSTLAVIVIHGK